MAKLGEFRVTDKGIELIDEVFYNGEMFCSKMIIPKETFIEAFNKYIIEPADLQKQLDKAVKMFSIDSKKGRCPRCGHDHYLKTKSDRCSYCGQKLIHEEISI